MPKTEADNMSDYLPVYKCNFKLQCLLLQSNKDTTVLDWIRAGIYDEDNWAVIGHKDAHIVIISG